jgi:TPR repeat protein
MKFNYHIVLKIVVTACFVMLFQPPSGLAQQTSKEDAYMLGMSFQLSQHMDDAIHWFTISAEQGHDLAQYSLGDIYFRGEGVKQDYPAALEWYLKSAGQGNNHAQLAAGTMYAQGHGTEQNYAEANKWFRRAADQSNGYAQFNLGIAYDKGYGVQTDYRQAFTWFHRAAEKEIPDAQFNVGMMYAGGTGVEQDPVKAYHWINKAAEQGHPIATAARTELESILTPAQIALGRSKGAAPPLSGPVINIPDFKPIPSPSEE